MKAPPDRSHPRLAFLSGVRAGETAPITTTVARIGRDSSNEIVVPDAWLSNSHCLIQTEPTGFYIYDLGSLNGTYVNGENVLKKAIHHGDRVGLGPTEALFLTEASVEASPAGRSRARHTIRLSPHDSRYLSPSGLDPALVIDPKMAGEITRLLRISNALRSARTLEALERAIVERTADATQSERVALMLTHPDGLQLLPPRCHPAPEGAEWIDRELAGRVHRDRTILKAETSGSVLSVPLTAGRQPIGVLYLERQASTFTEHDLDLVLAIASIAAAAVENVHRVERLEADRSRLLEEVRGRRRLIGESPAMRRVFGFLSKAAPSESTVLIEGESGTGKELAAWAIHDGSPRADGPFVTVNCAALPADLVESELFGHEKGAFTGAQGQKKGRFEIADRGTLFLDEIGELPLALQPKLLRAIQTGSFERVGAVGSTAVNVRIVAATNRDLTKAVRAGLFREDLFFRLNVLRVTMPPLRERREDIPLLADHFAARLRAKLGRPIFISPQACTVLQRYEWPGNVRELENAIERAAVLGSGDEILPEDLPESLLETEPAAPEPLDYRSAVNRFKKQHVLEVIGKASNLKEAAALLGIHPNNLARLIRTLNLRADLRRVKGK